MNGRKLLLCDLFLFELAGPPSCLPAATNAFPAWFCCN